MSSKERLLRLSCGFRKVHLPGRSEELTLVVVKGFAQEPLMLLKNVLVRRSRKSVWHMVQSYLVWWRIEEVIRLIKQSYQLEDIRLLTYVRLHNMIVLAMAAAYFAAVF